LKEEVGVNVGIEETNNEGEVEEEVKGEEGKEAEEEPEINKSFLLITSLLYLIRFILSISILFSLSFSDNEFFFILFNLSFRLGNQSLSESSDCFFFFLSFLSLSIYCCFRLSM
jgi:hypothetical protein